MGIINTIKNKSYLTAAALLLLAVVLFSDTIAWLLRSWYQNSEYGHGFLMPLISIYLIWRTRERFAYIERKENYFIGIAIILISGLLLKVGGISGILHLEGLSLIMFLSGVVVYFFGFQYLRVLLLPIFLLMLMLPSYNDIFYNFHMHFQLLSAHIATKTLNIINVPAFKQGILIQLPNITIEVAKECSGIKFLIAILSLGIPMVYLTQRSIGRAVIVLIAGVIITIAANSLRVTIACLMGNYYGVDMLHGPGHIFKGVFVAWVGLFSLFIINKYMAKSITSGNYRLYEKWKRLSHPEKYISSPIKTKTSVIYTILVSSLIVYIHAVPVPAPNRADFNFDRILFKIKGYRSVNADWFDKDKYFGEFDEELSKIYHASNPEDKSIKVFIGYLARQSSERRLISYKNKQLFVKPQKLQFTDNLDTAFDINYIVVPIDGVLHELYFWFTFPEGDFTNRYYIKAKSIVDALLYRSNCGAVTIIAREARNKKLTGNWEIEARDFINKVRPVVKALVDKDEII